MDDRGRNSRGSAGVAHDGLVTLEEFAREAELKLSSLAARRARKEDFPPPVNPGGRPLRFRRSELATWLEDNPLPRSQPAEQSVSALERAVERLVAERGAVATQYFLGGLLWLTGHDGFEDCRADGRELLLAQSRASLHRFRRKAYGEARRALSSQDLAAFTTLLEGGPSGTSGEPIPADSATAVSLVLTVLEECAVNRKHCTEALEERMLGLSHDSLELSRRTEDALVRLLLALAPPEPGKRFLDPACGFGSVLLAAHTATGDRGGAALVGRDSDEQAWHITKARLGARGIAHDLGAGPVDSLRDERLRQDRFDSVVAEPGGRLREASSWLRVVPGLLTDTGTAAIELTSDTLSAEHLSALTQDRVSAVVITPRAVRTETRERMAIWVLRLDAPAETLVIDLSNQNRRSQSTMPLSDDEIAAVGAMVEAHHQGGDPAAVPGAGRLTSWRVTSDDLARLGVLGAIEGKEPFVGSVFSAEPATRGLELARELRVLLDGTDGETGSGPLAGLVTDEVVRGVRRLVRQLERAVRPPTPTGDAPGSRSRGDLDDA